MQTGSPDQLNEREQDRLDSLLHSARTFHYLNFVVAALSLAFFSHEKPDEIKLPFGDITLPRIHAAVASYVLTIAFAIASDRLFRMASPWIKLDPRRPPYPWHVLGPTGKSSIASIWLLVPVVITAFAAGTTLGKIVNGVWLTLSALGLAVLARTFDEYLPHIKQRTDERGGAATFSIWLLYWTRILRQIGLLGGFFLFVLAAVPPWEKPMKYAGAILIAAAVTIHVLRAFCGVRFIYHRIDSAGARLGFPEKSPHYT